MRMIEFRLYDLRHTWAARAAESREVDMTTLAALLGHSKLNMVMRYTHPQERHRAETVERLEKANAARQIAEFEEKSIPTNSPTLPKNPVNFSDSKTEDKPNQINSEAPIGFEPMHKGFADLSLTTWVRRHNT